MERVLFVALRMKNVYVLRIPRVEYQLETYTLGADIKDERQLEKKLKADKNIAKYIMFN